MKIFSYDEFILEKLIVDLLLEANLVLMDDFIDVLSSMKSPVAKELLELQNKDLKITTNFLTLGEKDDEVAFYPANTKLKYQIIDTDESYQSYKQLYQFRGLEDRYYDLLPNGTIGEVVYIFEPGIAPNGNNRRIAHFVSDAGENIMIGLNGLKKLLIGKPQKSFIGRISRRIFDASGLKFTDKEIEDFVNEFRLKRIGMADKFRNFEIVDKDLIKRYYLYENYDNKQEYTLHQSCMRYTKAQKFLGIYVNNPDVCKLLILRSDDSGDKIVGRALVWKLKDGTTFMDRIYYSNDTQANLFKEYAQKEGWCYKSQQNSKADTPIEFSPDLLYEKELIVEGKFSGYDDYPYMDTLKYLNEYKETLSNIQHDDEMELESTEGGRPGEDCERCDGTGRVTCRDCRGDGEVDCEDCDGNGTVDCDYCDGDGDFECSDCGGDGTMEDSEGNKVDCDSCDGDGRIECSDCNGRGTIECNNCGGRGMVTCGDCDGDGDVDCPTCN